MTEPSRLALDEDPDAALAVITGQRKGSRAYAAICLADAIRNGCYPAGWDRLGDPPPDCFTFSVTSWRCHACGSTTLVLKIRADWEKHSVQLDYDCPEGHRAITEGRAP